MTMTSSSEYEGEELEAMRPSDSSWHPCKVYPSAFGICLFIDFGSCQPEDMVVTEVEALERLRFRSTPFTNDDCNQINLGEHVLVAHQSPSEINHCDAIVKKVLRIRHSKRNNCNCTFVIEFLKRKGELINVKSDSIMRLRKKNVQLHPVVCEFLKAIKSLGESTASPCFKVDRVTGTTEDLNGVLEVKESCDVSKNDITMMTVLGLKVAGKAPLQRRLIDAFNLTDRCVQVSGDMENQKILLQMTETSQPDMDTEDTVPSVPSISEIPKNRFCLSPLGARAALASLVSTIHAPVDNAANLLTPSILINASTADDKVSSRSKSSFFGADLAAHSANEINPREPGNSGRLTRSAARKVSRFPEDDSSDARDVKTSRLISCRRSTRSSILINASTADDKVSSRSKSSFFGADLATHSATEINPPEPGNSVRLTQSAARKVSRFPEDDSSDARDVKTSRLISCRRSTRSSGREQHINIGDKRSEVTDLVQPKVMKSMSRKENKIFQVEDDIDGCSLSELTSEVHCAAPSSVASEFAESKSSMACAASEVNVPVATKRLTRSSSRTEKNSENHVVALLTESSAVSRRCTRYSGLGRSESMVASDQGPEDCDLVSISEKKSNIKHVSQRNEKLPLGVDFKTNLASDKNGEKKSDGIDNRGQGKTASSSGRNPGQKRKAVGLLTLAAERRFSPRLRDLYQEWHSERRQHVERKITSFPLKVYDVLLCEELQNVGLG